MRAAGQSAEAKIPERWRKSPWKATRSAVVMGGKEKRLIFNLMVGSEGCFHQAILFSS